MKEEIRKDLLCALDNSIKALKEERDASLQKISDECIKCSSIYGDDDSINLSIIIYSIGKLSMRNQIKPMKNWRGFRQDLLRKLDKARTFLKNKRYNDFKKIVSNLYNSIGRADEQIKLYVQEVLENAKIKKGCKMHEQGISIQKASERYGVDLWKLQEYVGKTRIPEDRLFRTNVLERLKFARKLFLK